jgi:type II secretory pathway pseudopilin PulG
MIEIALSLGVIAIALVAIIGVLPTGVRVQRDNREDTILNQEGQLLLEAIRSGSRGLDYLTNYFDVITISNLTEATFTNFYNPAGFIPAASPNNEAWLTNGQNIISLLTYPKYTSLQNGNLLTNRVTARVRAITGSAAEKGRTADARDFAFAYQVVSEVVPLRVYPPEYLNVTDPGLSDPEKVARTNRARLELNRAVNFNELRLTLQGPLIPKGKGYDVLGTPKTFRTLLGGATAGNHLVVPSTFVQVQ